MMSNYTQEDRPLKITTLLGEDVLLIYGFCGHEEISRLFDFEVSLIADLNKEVRFDSIVGESVTVKMRLIDSSFRYFNGIVNRFTQQARDEKFLFFRAQVVPSCDFIWSFNEAGTSTGDLPRATRAAGDSRMPALPDLDKTSALLDKFYARMLSLPGAENHPDLKAQIDFIQGNKQALRLAQAEELAGIKARLDRLAAATEQSKQQEEAGHKKMEERNAPLPPLDGHALAQALLKNLGFK
jgi:hypothetical protein